MARKKSKETQEQVVEEQQLLYQYDYAPNRFYLDDRDMQSPYVQAYIAARREGPMVTPNPNFFNVPQATAATSAEAPVEQESPKPVKKSKGKKKRAKRGFFVFLLFLFLLLMVAYFALSFIDIPALNDYTAFTVRVTKPTPADGVDAEDKVENVNLMDIAMGTVDSFKKNPNPKEDKAPAAEAADSTGDEVFVDASQEEEKSWIYYEDRMENVKSLDTVGKASAYGLPVSIAVMLLVTLIFFIRSVVSLFTPNRRKGFIASSLIMLVLGILVNLFAFMWAAGTEFDKFGEFYHMFAAQSELHVQGSWGMLAVVVLPLLMFIASLFCFRRKKKVGK